MLKRFLSYYKPQMGLFVADTVCALVLAAIDLAFPIILRNLTGGLFTQGQAAIMQALGMIAVGLVLMYAVRCACRYFVSYWGHVMGARMESKMREDLFDQYERFSFAYFDRNSSGDMMSRVVNDLFDICEAAHHVPEWIIICGIEIIGSFVILFTIAPVLALAMAVVAAAFAVGKPSPGAVGRGYSGVRRTVERAPFSSNSSSTKVGVLSSAYLQRSMEPSRMPLLG